MVTDPISDLIIRIKNASKAGKTSTEVANSKFAENVARLLKKEGYVSSVDKSKDGRALSIELLYFEDEPRIHGVERVSKPSKRVYQKSRDIRSHKSGFGNVIYSTPKGVMTDSEAKKLKVGGEVLFKIW